MESQENPRSIGSRVRRGIAVVVRTFDPTLEDVLLDQIDERTVAVRVKEYIHSRLRIPGKKEPRLFTVADVLRSMNHVDSSINPNYRERFPNEHQRIHMVLHRLANSGVLLEEFLDKPDVDKEIAFYRVVDEKRLKVIASGSKQVP